MPRRGFGRKGCQRLRQGWLQGPLHGARFAALCRYRQEAAMLRIEPGIQIHTSRTRRLDRAGRRARPARGADRTGGRNQPLILLSRSHAACPGAGRGHGQHRTPSGTATTPRPSAEPFAALSTDQKRQGPSPGPGKFKGHDPAQEYQRFQGTAYRTRHITVARRI